MNLPKGEYSVLTRDNIIALMPSDEKEVEQAKPEVHARSGGGIGVPQ
jgi:hypothetical protein